METFGSINCSFFIHMDLAHSMVLYCMGMLQVNCPDTMAQMFPTILYSRKGNQKAQTKKICYDIHKKEQWLQKNTSG